MEQTWSIRLIRFSAIFGIIGTFIGSQMSGNMDYSPNGTMETIAHDSRILWP